MSIKQICGKLFKLALMTVAAVVFSVGAMWAQNVKVSGKVTDKTGEPLPGVYVLVQGTKAVAFSSMGFVGVVQPINNRAVINDYPLYYLN
jgi:hypothetical protein